MSLRGIDYSLHYRKYHDCSDKNWREMKRYFFRSLEPYLPDQKAAPILDIGCGFGFGVQALLDAGYTNVRGIDADAGQVSVAQSQGVPVSLIPVNETATFLRSECGQLALVYAFDVLEHIAHDDQIDFLRDVAAALRPGGLLVCRVPNALSPVGLYGRYLDWTHTTSFCRDSLEFVFANAALKTLSVTAAPEPTPDSSVIRSLLKNILRVPVRVVTRGWWRLILISELGVAIGLKEPVTPNILAIAKKLA